MVHEEPVEAGTAIVLSRSELLSPLGRPMAPARRRSADGRRLAPSVSRALTNKDAAAVSGLAAAVIAAAGAAAIAGRLAWPRGGEVRRAADELVRHMASPSGDVRISWTHVEVRWLVDR